MWQGWTKCSPAPPPALPVYPAGGDPSPQRTRTDCTSQAAGQTMPKPGRANTRVGRPPKSWARCTGLHPIPDRPRRADRTGGGRWRAWSVSETEQICTHSNMNDFQHKNVCKTVDINTRTCYYIDNTRTCYTTTKQEDKNHETRI